MFIEGFYLHNSVVVNVFQDEEPILWRYLVIGWGTFLIRYYPKMNNYFNENFFDRHSGRSRYDMGNGYDAQAITTASRKVHSSILLVSENRN